MKGKYWYIEVDEDDFLIFCPRCGDVSFKSLDEYFYTDDLECSECYFQSQVDNRLITVKDNKLVSAKDDRLIFIWEE